MKSWKKFLIVSLSFLFVAASVLGGLSNFGRLNSIESNNSSNPESSVVTPGKPNDYGGMIYYASDIEETGAAVAPKEMKGGAIYIGNGTKFTMDSGLITNHEGMFGGAIYIANGGTFTMTGGTIEYNYSKYGGAIYVEEGGTCNISGGYIMNNKSENAPAIYAEDGSTLNLVDGQVTIDSNDYILFQDTIINYYVDGVCVESSLQSAPTLNLSKAPLDYSECNGYFFDEEMSEPVEQGDDLTLFDNTNTLQTANETGYFVYNLYTKSATLDKLKFELNADNNSYAVKAINSSVTGDIVIPREHNNLVVNTISESAFEHTSIQSVCTSSKINKIGAMAFLDCGNLKTVEILSTNLTEIKSHTFMNCKKLTDVLLPDSVSVISDYVFKSCSLLASIKLPENLTSIGNECFFESYSLESIIIPNKVTTINYGAFHSCLGLKTLTIGTSVNDICGDCFRNCSSLEKINFNAVNIKENISNDNFRGISSNCELIIGDDVITIPSNLFMSSAISSIIWGDSVSKINNNAFNGCTNLQNLTLSESIQTIGDNAFAGCSKLTNISFKNGISNIKSIGAYAFQYCSELNWFALTNIETIGANAFKECSKLTSVDLSSSKLKEIPEFAFAYCKALTSVDLNENITTIKNNAFYNCVLLSDIELPSKLEVIKSSAFYGCVSLKSITIGEGVTQIGGEAFRNCTNLSTINFNAVNCGNLLTNDSFRNLSANCNAVIGNNVTRIPSNLFAYSPIKTIVIGSNVTEIGTSAFISCSNLINVDIPNSVKTLSSSAFNGCSKLESVTIGEGVKTFGSETFRNCTSLKTINFNASSCNNVAGYGYNFYNISSDAELLVGEKVELIPSNLFSSSSIKTVKLGSSVSEINQEAFYGCSKLTSVTSNGDIKLKTIKVNPYAFYNCSSLVSVEFDIGYIYENAFRNCTSLNNVTLTNYWIRPYTFYNCTSLQSVNYNYQSEYNSIDNEDIIEEFAFANCSSLSSIDIPDSVIQIGNSAFENCTTLSNVGFSSNLISIGSKAFNNCSALTDFYEQWIELDSLYYIGSNAFSNCNKLESVYIPESVEQVRENAFGNCAGLLSVDVNGANTNVTDTAFAGCNNLEMLYLNTASVCTSFAGIEALESVLFGESVTTIRGRAFENCTNLSSVEFDSDCNLISIEAWAFANCTSLTSISLPNKLSKIYSYAFQDSGLSSITLPASVQRVGRNCFNTCTSVTFVEGASTGYKWQVQDSEGYAILNNVDVLRDPQANATMMKELFNYGYWIRSDYTSYIDNNEVITIFNTNGTINANFVLNKGESTTLSVNDNYSETERLVKDVQITSGSLIKNGTLSYLITIKNNSSTEALIIKPYVYDLVDIDQSSFYFTTESTLDDYTHYTRLLSDYVSILEGQTLTLRYYLSGVSSNIEKNVLKSAIFIDVYGEDSVPVDYVPEYEFDYESNDDASNVTKTPVYNYTQWGQPITVSSDKIVKVTNSNSESVFASSTADETIYVFTGTFTTSVLIPRISVARKNFVLLGTPSTIMNSYIFVQAQDLDNVVIQGLRFSGVNGYLRIYNHLNVMNNIYVKDCRFWTDTPNMNDSGTSGFAAIQIEEQDDRVGTISNVYIRNNTIFGTYQGVMLRCVTNQYIYNNTIQGTFHNAIGIQHYAQTTGSRYSGDVYIVENTIKNIGPGFGASDERGERAIRFGSGKNVNAYVYGNEFSNAVEKENGDVLKTSTIEGISTFEFTNNYYDDMVLPDGFKRSTTESGTISYICTLGPITPDSSDKE